MYLLSQEGKAKQDRILRYRRKRHHVSCCAVSANILLPTIISIRELLMMDRHAQ
jgi:hypothetical protein